MIITRRIWSGGLRALAAAMIAVFLLFPDTGRAYPGIVIDSTSGKVLLQEEVNQSWYPASLTKLMTLYLTFDALRSGQLSLDDKLTVSAHAASQPRTHLGLRKGESLSVEDAIKAVATISANDAAVVLAERLKGTEALFAQEMTRRAKALGMQASIFRNASGLPDASQKTTAKDMALLAREVIRTFPQYFHYFSNSSISYKGKRRSTTNGFVSSYRGADGLKTGFTCGSGYNLIATAVRDDKRLIGVVLGAGSGGERSARMRKLLDLGFNKVREPVALPAIGDLASIQSAELSSPPYRLDHCGRSPSPGGNMTVAHEGNLPGWGILLGIQKGKNGALSVVKKARSLLKRIQISSKPAILKRQFDKGSSWKVLLVGLEKAQAGLGCRHLLSNSVNCVIQSPKRMNSPGYSLR